MNKEDSILNKKFIEIIGPGIGNIDSIMKLDISSEPEYTGPAGGPLDLSMFHKSLPIGTTVSLKSGGPKMVVNSWSNGQDYCECIWFAKRDAGPYMSYTDELIIKMFHVATLKMREE